MQGFSSTWTPPGGTLGRITAEARERAALLSPRVGELEAAALAAPARASLAAALRGGTLGVVAEVKRRSPSKGAIAPALDAATQAAAYADGGAAALSILTEPAHFGGSLDDLAASAARVAVPLLRKDFIVSAGQLFEARAAGASAALLIARALAPAELDALADHALAIGLEVLIEVRSEEELSRAVDAGADVIGVNTRDLETLVIDPAVAERLLPLVPRSVPAVWESGIVSRDDVARAAAAGANAVLVGSSVSAAADPAAAVRLLADVPVVGR